MMLSPVFARFAPALAAFLLLLLPAFAQAQPSRTISFDEAVRIALERNIDLQKVANNVEMQAAMVSRRRADFLPSLNFSTGPNQRFGLTFDQTAGRLVQESSQSLSAGLNSQVTLFNGFNNIASLRQAQHEYQAVDLSYDRTRQRVVFDVASRFLQVLLDKELIDIRRENMAAQQQQLARIEELTRVGARPISDSYQQQANLAASELELLNAERNLEISNIRLIQMLELDPFENYEFAAPAADAASLQLESYDLEDLITTALQQRVDLQMQQSRILAAGEGIRAARGSLWPTLSLSSQYNSSYSSLRPQTFDDQFLRNNRSGGIGFNISFPIFDRYQTRTNVQSAQVQYDNARLDLQNLRKDIALEVRQAYLDYLTIAKRLDVTQIQMEASELALQAEQERYNLGASTLVELTQAQAGYTQAASNRAQAVYNFLFQSKIIDYYTGQTSTALQLFD